MNESERAKNRKLEQKREHERLRQIEERWVAITESTQDAILMMDAEGRVSYWNRAAEHMLGHTRDDAIGRNLHDLIAPARFHPAFHKAFRKFQHSGRGSAVGKIVDLEALRKDGKEISIQLSLSAVRMNESWQALGIIRDITARKHVEDELSRKEHLLSESQRLGHIGSFINNFSGPITWSAEMYRLHGVSPDTFIPTVESLLGLIHPDDRQSMQEGIAACAAGEKPSSLVFRINRPDGTMRYLRGWGEVIFDGENRPIYMVGTAQDITEQEKFGEALRTSEEKYRIIAENMADVITTMDMNLRFTYVTPSIMQLRGYTVDEAMEQTIDQIMTPDSFQLVARAFEEELRLEATATANPDRTRIFELEEYKKDGSIIWVENTISFIRDKDQKPIGILIVSRDITERKLVEDALRDSEAQYRLLADNVSDVIWTMDVKQGFTYTSPSVQKILGYTPEEALQVPLKTLLTPESYEKVVQVITKAIARDGEPGVSPDVTLALELEHIRKDGSTLWTEITTSFIRNEEGLLSGFIGITRDIAERRQAEEQRDKLISDLQKALDEVNTLSGLLPICSYCKNIRDDKGYWNKIESYIHKHSDTQFSHGICPECAKKYYPDMDLFGDAE